MRKSQECSLWTIDAGVHESECHRLQRIFMRLALRQSCNIAHGKMHPGQKFARGRLMQRVSSVDVGPECRDAHCCSSFAGALYATNIGAFYPLGMEGWRFAFLSVGIVR